MTNQKKILLKYATENGFPNPLFFIDDGVSGITFDRPGWNEMIGLAETGKTRRTRNSGLWTRKPPKSLSEFLRCA
ncbi:TPA: recombinase family protein [Clostridioides difficile]